MKELGEYLYKDVKVICTDGETFDGTIESFGGSAQGKEDYGVEEDYIDLRKGGTSTVLFKSEIENIEEL